MPTIRAGQINMYYESYGQGVPLVLIMGLECPGKLWLYQVDELAKDYRVIIFDNRGVGRTDRPAMDYSTEMFADDTENLLTALGISKAHILGMSMGGAIAQQLALRHPQMVDKLILCCTFSEPAAYGLMLLKVWQEVAERAGMETLAKLSLVQSLTPRFFAERPEVVQRLLDIFTEHPQPVEAYVRQNLACVRHRATDMLAVISRPTLVLVGNRDTQTPVGSAKIIANQIPGAQLQVLHSLGHGLMWEAPTLFNEVVSDFLSRSR